MLKKRTMVYLDTGAVKQHEIAVENDAEYVHWVNVCADALTGNPKGILVFTTPLCIYRVGNIVAVEFVDPPAATEKVPIGFRPNT